MFPHSRCCGKEKARCTFDRSSFLKYTESTSFRVSQQEEKISSDINLFPLRPEIKHKQFFLHSFSSSSIHPTGFAAFTLIFSHAESVQSVWKGDVSVTAVSLISLSTSTLSVCLSVLVLSHHRLTPACLTSLRLFTHQPITIHSARLRR